MANRLNIDTSEAALAGADFSEPVHPWVQLSQSAVAQVETADSLWNKLNPERMGHAYSKDIEILKDKIECIDLDGEVNEAQMKDIADEANWICTRLLKDEDLQNLFSRCKEEFLNYTASLVAFKQIVTPQTAEMIKVLNGRCATAFDKIKTTTPEIQADSSQFASRIRDIFQILDDDLSVSLGEAGVFPQLECHQPHLEEVATARDIAMNALTQQPFATFQTMKELSSCARTAIHLVLRG